MFALTFTPKMRPTPLWHKGNGDGSDSRMAGSPATAVRLVEPVADVHAPVKGCDQGLLVGHQRPCIDFFRAAQFHDLAEVHDCDAIREVMHCPQVMRHKQAALG